MESSRENTSQRTSHTSQTHIRFAAHQGRTLHASATFRTCECGAETKGAWHAWVVSVAPFSYTQFFQVAILKHDYSTSRVQQATRKPRASKKARTVQRGSYNFFPETRAYDCRLLRGCGVRRGSRRTRDSACRSRAAWRHDRTWS